MPKFVFKKHRISPKNGMVSYKQDTRRGTGTVYFMAQCFTGGVPETVTIEADYLTESKPEPVAEPAAPVAEAASAAE